MMALWIERVRSFRSSEDAVAATEYAILLGLIVAVCIGSISGIGVKVDASFAMLDSAVTVAMP